MSGGYKLSPESKWHRIRNLVRKKRVDDTSNATTGRNYSSNWEYVYRKITQGTSSFFGLQEDQGYTDDKWNIRLKQLYGDSGMFALKDTAPREMEMDEVDGSLLPPSRDRGMKPKRNVFSSTYSYMKGDKRSLTNRSYTLVDINRTRMEERYKPRPIGQSRFFDEAMSTGGVVAIPPTNFRAFRTDLPNGMSVRNKKIMGDYDDVDAGPVISEGIDGSMLKELMDNSSRGREIGTGGWVGKHILNIEKDHSKIDSTTSKQLLMQRDNLHRPFFTYWVTFVQLVCYIVAVCVYGFAPIGFHETEVKAEVFSSKMYVELLRHNEKDNFWIGPRQADLIHLGAKYSPCMRKDRNVEEAIMADRARENQTACCIMNDGAGCVQTSRAQCSSILSTWHENKVCGQDPNYCLAPASEGPYKWPSSIIEWPICTKTANLSKRGPAHMTCQQAGKPCCIGTQGECRVSTREECDFWKGVFHEEATLCSQVSCMDKTCGMLPFWNPDTPDQFYRLWISLFVHAGVIQLLITIFFQFILMRDVEKLLGWLRVSIIYILSGVVGSLASAIFVPYHVEAGPSGSQFGIFSCLFVELISTWPIIKHPHLTLIKLTLLLLLLLVIGLLPMIDNYAHIFGFIYGFLLSFSLMPHVKFGLKDRKIKNIAVVCSFICSLLILLILTLLFYVIPIYHCPNCMYFSCIPFTEGFCDTMEVKIRRPVL